jgi:hypothetical protein
MPLSSWRKQLKRCAAIILQSPPRRHQVIYAYAYAYLLTNVQEGRTKGWVFEFRPVAFQGVKPPEGSKASCLVTLKQGMLQYIPK